MQEPFKYSSVIRNPVADTYAVALAARESYKSFEQKLKEQYPQVARELEEELNELNSVTDKAQAGAARARHEANKKQSEP